MNVWTPGGIEGTATGTAVPVIADGDVFATVSPIWSDEDGVRVSVDWTEELDGGWSRLADMSAAQATALADALRQVAAVDPPA